MAISEIFSKAAVHAHAKGTAIVPNTVIACKRQVQMQRSNLKMETAYRTPTANTQKKPDPHMPYTKSETKTLAGALPPDFIMNLAVAHSVRQDPIQSSTLRIAMC